MLGIALEGGGAKGAFHIGAIQACMEMGFYPPDAVAGTSIGAMNGAMIVQGDFEKAKELWETISGKDIFLPDDEKLINATFKDIDFDKAGDMLSAIKDLISDGGVDNTNVRAIIDTYVNPEKVMASPMDFGIVTFAVPEFRAVEIFKNDMGLDGITKYILASAAFPGFQRVKIGQSTFIDGGVYDNCPVNMLLERGCDRVIAVRTNAVGVTRYNEKDPRVITISPSGDLGSVMKFSPEVSKNNIKLGYYDGLRALMKLGGRRYYLTDTELDLAEKLYSLPDEVIIEAAKAMKISHRIHPKRLLFERVLPVLFDEMKLTKKESYDDLILAMTEDRAERCGIERLSLYTAKELLKRGLALEPLGEQKKESIAADMILEALSN